MKNAWVTFIAENGTTWELEIPLAQVQLIATIKPLIDGNEGTEVYEIDEFRYDVEKNAFSFWLKFPEVKSHEHQ